MPKGSKGNGTKVETADLCQSFKTDNEGKCTDQYNSSDLSDIYTKTKLISTNNL